MEAEQTDELSTNQHRKDAYKSKVDNLMINNEALSQALRTSQQTIYHQDKIIANLEKKLIAQFPEILIERLETIGSTLRQVVELVEDTTMLLKSNAISSVLTNEQISSVNSISMLNSITARHREYETSSDSVENGIPIKSNLKAKSKSAKKDRSKGNQRRKVSAESSTSNDPMEVNHITEHLKGMPKLVMDDEPHCSGETSKNTRAPVLKAKRPSKTVKKLSDSLHEMESKSKKQCTSLSSVLSVASTSATKPKKSSISPKSKQKIKNGVTELKKQKAKTPKKKPKKAISPPIVNLDDLNKHNMSDKKSTSSNSEKSWSLRKRRTSLNYTDMSDNEVSILEDTSSRGSSRRSERRKRTPPIIKQEIIDDDSNPMPEASTSMLNYSTDANLQPKVLLKDIFMNTFQSPDLQASIASGSNSEAPATVDEEDDDINELPVLEAINKDSEAGTSHPEKEGTSATDDEQIPDLVVDPFTNESFTVLDSVDEEYSLEEETT